jgi:hypothetical protein
MSQNPNALQRNHRLVSPNRKGCGLTFKLLGCLSPGTPLRHPSLAKCLPASIMEHQRSPVMPCRTGTFAYLHTPTSAVPRQRSSLIPRLCRHQDQPRSADQHRHPRHRHNPNLGITDLPPHPRLHRSPPHRGVRRDGRIPLDRAPNRLEHQESRPHRPPIPHRATPRRTTDPHRRRPLTRRSR